MIYSPQTLEMVARRAYAAANNPFNLNWDDEPPRIKESMLAIARWHLDEIGGVLEHQDDLSTHRWKQELYMDNGRKPCPHCAKPPTPTDPNEYEL